MSTLFKVLASVLVILNLSFIIACRSSDTKLQDVPETVYRGFIIQKDFQNLDIKSPLEFIFSHETILFRLLKKHVRKIEYSPYHYTRNYPYFDVISISRFTLERSAAHSASVIIHELFHIILNNLRRNNTGYGTDEKTFLLKAGIKYDDINGMDMKTEERFAYLLQYRFIKKYGSDLDRDYQRLKLEKLGIL